MNAEEVIHYVYQLSAATGVLGFFCGILAVIFTGWLRGYLAERRRCQQFKIHRRTPLGI